VPQSMLLCPAIRRVWRKNQLQHQTHSRQVMPIGRQPRRDSRPALMQKLKAAPLVPRPSKAGAEIV